MKVYVDELPKKCLKCPCFDRCGYMCKINKKLLDTVGKESADNSRDEDCPLQSLSDYTKQVRKEVCEEIREKAYDLFCDDTIGWLTREEMFLEYLDQIQGEIK